MKRKVKKYDDGGKVYDKEDKGLFGNTIKYREEDGRKYVAGNANPYDRNPEEKRYYSMDDVKGKLSGLFGGKKEEAPQAEYKSRGDRFADTNVEERPRQMTDSMTNKPKAADKTYLREEADIEDKPAKKAAPRQAAPKSKIEAAAPAPQKAKASTDSGIPKDTKSTRMPSGYEKLDVSEKKSMGKDATPMKKEEGKGFSTNMGKTPEEREARAKANREAVADSVSGITKYFRNPFAGDDEEKPKKKTFERKLNAKPTADQMKKMAKGGSVKSSASSRGDGCAVRGKTKGRIY